MSQPDDHPHTRAVLTAVVVTVLWSSSWILIRIGLDSEALQPITFAGLRYSLACVVLWGVVLGRRESRAAVASLGARGWRSLVVLGVVYYAVTQGAQFIAIDAQPAATTSLMLAPTPLLVAVLSHRSIGEAVDQRQVVGALLMLLGALAYFAGDLGATVIGMIAAVVALAANAAGALLGRAVNREQRSSPLTVTVGSMTAGSVLLLLVGLGIEGAPSLSPRAIAVVAWLAIVNTAVAFTMWNASLRRLAAVESAAINNTMLVQIAVLAWVFLGEAPGLLGGLGIAIVSIGALLVQGVSLTSLIGQRSPRP